MSDHDRRQGRPGQRPGQRGGQKRGTGSAGRPDEPALPADVAASDLDPEVRRDLLTLDKANAENVARHLVMVTRLLEEDPALALEHARAARRRAGRIGLIRETAGIAAYNAGEWQEAISELRAARRITGSDGLLPLIADSERGLGRAERAIEIARSEEGRALTGEEASEMRIVEAGARIDLGEPEKALVTLQLENLAPGQTGTGPARLFYAYASALLAAGRTDDATTWFMNAASADIDDVTDAELRLVELSEGLPEDLEESESEAVAEPARESVPATEAEPESVPAPEAEPEPGPEPEAAPAVAAEPDLVSDPTVQTDPTVQAEPAAAASQHTEPQHAEPQRTIIDTYEALLLDLDGTVFAGHRPIPGAVDTLAAVSLPQFFVTNNASRRPDAVAEHLTELGFTATPEQVVTSAQSGARLLSEHLEPGSRALVLGTDGLAQEVREVGIGVTRSADDRPAAVIQGYSPDIGWAELSEAALAIRAGALWVATNIDATLPSERGQLVGNGSLVAAVANATGASPLVAGKPAAPLMVDAIRRSGVNRSLVVGDRLDTDIEGAHAVGLDSVLVLSGVSTAADLLAAPPERRPTFVVDDLRGLLTDPESARIVEQAGWTVTVDGDVVSVSRADASVSTSTLLPALAAAVWQFDDESALDHGTLRVAAAEPEIASALQALGLRVVG